jgi:DNA adenine methylase
MITTDAPRRPTWRHHGGKFRIREAVCEHMPKHTLYCELFGGAGSVLLAKQKSKIEIYNDLEFNAVNVFRVLRDPEKSIALKEALESTLYARSEFDNCFPIDEGDDVERARRYITMSLQSIGAKGMTERSGWRSATSNCNGSPAYSWRTYPRHIVSFFERLREVVIESRPALQLIDTYDAVDTLFYADPPYMLGTRAQGYRKVYENEMSDDDHAQLIAKLKTLKGMVLLSGYRSELYDLELRDWKRVDIAARAQTNAPRTECLWISPNTPNGGLFA